MLLRTHPLDSIALSNLIIVICLAPMTDGIFLANFECHNGILQPVPFSIALCELTIVIWLAPMTEEKKAFFVNLESQIVFLQPTPSLFDTPKGR